MWLRMNDLRTAALGSVHTVLPALLSVHGSIMSESDADSIAARAFLTFSSKARTRSAVEPNCGLMLPPSVGLTSSSSDSIVMRPNRGRFPMWDASSPIVRDLVCGAHAARPSGTRSSIVRVVAISRSNSGSTVADIDIAVPLVWWCDGDGPRSPTLLRRRLEPDTGSCSPRTAAARRCPTVTAIRVSAGPEIQMATPYLSRRMPK